MLQYLVRRRELGRLALGAGERRSWPSEGSGDEVGAEMSAAHCSGGSGAAHGSRGGKQREEPWKLYNKLAKKNLKLTTEP